MHPDKCKCEECLPLHFIDRYCFECNKIHGVLHRGRTQTGEEILYCTIKREEYTLFTKEEGTSYEKALINIERKMPNMALAYIVIAFYEMIRSYLNHKEDGNGWKY